MTTTLITGASSGLGAEMARQLAALGHDLALCARRTDRLAELAEEITAAHGVRVEHRALDVNDHAQVREVTQAFAADFGRIDRYVVNAGLGKGAPVGTGRPDANLETVEVNVLGALAQAEAAMEVFRAQHHGHLVLVSSVAALRGLPGPVTTYAATKAFVASLGEGLRHELLGRPDLDIRVTTIFPGYIRSEMNEHVRGTPFMAGTVEGVRAMVEAIEAERPAARVPGWPWGPLGGAMRVAPLPVLRRMVGGRG